MKRIFISYSHKDETWKERLTSHLEVLQMEGYCRLWDDRKIKPGDDWFPEIEQELNEAQIAVLLISTNFLTSHFIRHEEVPSILARRQKEGVWVIPLIVKPCAWDSVDWLSALQVLPKDGKPLSTMEGHEIDTELADLVKRIAARIKVKDKKENGSKPTPVPPEKISISKLPTTGKDLFGREKELAMLDGAWKGEDGHTHVVCFVAWGGVGKTALVNEWLNRMEKEDYCGARRVYGWSFYSQGAAEGRQASADEFMQETLAWFGDKDPTAGSGVDKARRLADLIRAGRTLLILDGMEPLQYPPGELSGFDGMLKDQGLKTLLKELAASQPGICVVTTRETVTDLSNMIGRSVKEIELEHLSDEAGAQLLTSLGVKGAQKEIVKAVKEYNGHALALTLLGNYLHTVFKGDVRQRDKIPKLTLERKKGRHARRVMAAYEHRLGESPELNILRIMGLFDRPVEKAAIDALRQEAIPGISEKLSDEDWPWALANLRTAGLLAKEDAEKPDLLDCHPLIREHFAEKLQTDNPDGWKEAHTRLYHYFKDLPEKELPDTLEEMAPLFAAVAHGCAAGLHQQALIKVFWQRIARGEEGFVFSKLGAFGAYLSVISHFFVAPWSKLAAGLSDHDKATVLNWAGFGLRAVGRLIEAVQSMEVSLENYLENKSWVFAAMASGNLSQMLLTLGRVDQAIDYARKGVDYADRSGDSFQKRVMRAALADALHQADKTEEAEKLFLESEEMQKEYQPGYPFLYSLQGFLFCDLLLGQGKYREVSERAEKTLKWAKQFGSLLSNAIDNISLGRARLMQALAEETGDFTAAADDLHRAVEGLRESGNQDDLPRGLFARAECFRVQGKFKEAWADLEEAQEIAELGGMGLFLADYHLEAGKLCRAEGKKEEAWEHFIKAKEMMEEMGYGRKLGEVKKALNIE